MKIGRSIIYALACVVAVTALELGVMSIFDSVFSGTRWIFVITWISVAIVTLLIAKWYFKQDEPTLLKGVKLGILPAVLLLAFTYWFSGLWGGLPYWKAQISPLIVFLATAYAGFEFDQTYTKES